MAADKDDFGSCCEYLKEILESKGFSPLLAVDEDDVLYMSVGMLDAGDGEASLVDHPVFFCPFCGTALQTEEEVEAKSGGSGDES